MPFKVPLTDTPFVAETEVVLAVKDADVPPAAMVTLAGTCTDVLALISLTIAPPFGVGPVNVTVPVELVPPATEAGLKVMALTVVSPIVSDAVLDVVP